MALIVKHVVAFLALLESILREEGIARVSRLSHQGNDIPLTLAYAAMCFSDAMATSPIGSFVLKNLVERAVKELHVKHIAAYARVSGMSFP